VIGELYFGNMFGFMQNSHDHGNYIESLDNLIPPMCVAAVGPSYLRGFLLTGLPMVSAKAKKAMSAIGHISTAAKDCVGRRLRGEDDVERRDILNQLLDIVASKGEKDDFQVPEVEQEAYSGLLVTTTVQTEVRLTCAQVRWLGHYGDCTSCGFVLPHEGSGSLP
jgi:hypothetical protein